MWLRNLTLVGLVTLTACSGISAEPTSTTPDTQTPSTTVASAAPTAKQSTTTATATTGSSSSTSTTTTTTTTTLPPLVLAFAGDTAFTHGSETRDPLGDITEWLSLPDLMFVNLETTIAEPNVGVDNGNKYTFKSPPSSVDLLTASGIDAVQLANNHILDFGPDATGRTVEILDEAGIAHSGAGSNAADAYAPVVIEENGWRIGFVSFSRIPCHWSVGGENTRPQTAWACAPFLLETIKAVQQAAHNTDFVVVMVHWGIERNHCPETYQRELARTWAQFGADVIVGGHPHVLQGVEQVEGAWLINSTGNFAFPSARGASSYSAVYEFTITQDGVSLQVKPVRIVGGRPRPANETDTATILDDLTKWSVGYEFDAQGHAIPSDSPSVCGSPGS